MNKTAKNMSADAKVTLTLDRDDAELLRWLLVNQRFPVTYQDFVNKVCTELYEKSQGHYRDEQEERRTAVKALRDLSFGLVKKAKESAANSSLEDMYLEDAGNLRFLSTLIERCDPFAKEYCARLDTSVRDCIPECAYEFVGLRKLYSGGSV